MDVFDEEALSYEEEEALWNLHHAAAVTGDESATQPDEKLPPSSSDGQPPQSRFVGEYNCDECGETFFSIVQLAKHRQFHDRDRPYECSICGKRFLSRSHHHEHQRVHTGERPYPCERCERSFTTHHNLKRHMTIHEKEEMYRCQQCGVLFCQEHEYNVEKLRLPTSATATLATEEAPPRKPAAPELVPMPMPVAMPVPMPVSMPTRFESFETEHTIEEDDAPSSSNAMTRIEQILMEKKKKKKQLKKKQALSDVSRSIASLPLYSPPKKKQKPEPTPYYEHPVHEFRRRELKRGQNMQRVAYDIEVVL